MKDFNLELGVLYIKANLVSTTVHKRRLFYKIQLSNN